VCIYNQFGFVPHLIKIVSQDTSNDNFEMQKHAIITLSNIVIFGNIQEIKHLVVPLFVRYSNQDDFMVLSRTINALFFYEHRLVDASNLEEEEEEEVNVGIVETLDEAMILEIEAAFENSIPRLCGHLTSTSSDLDICLVEILGTLANVTLYSTVLRDKIIDHGTIPIVMELFNATYPDEDIDYMVRILANLCFLGQPSAEIPPNFDIVKQTLPAFIQVIKKEERMTTNNLTYALCGLKYLCENPHPESVSTIIQAGIIPKLSELISEDNDDTILSSILCILSRICFQNNQLVVDGFHIYGFTLLSFLSEGIFLKEICTLLCCLSKHSTSIQSCLIDAGFIPWLIRLLNEPNETTGQKEAIESITNVIIEGTIDQKMSLVRQDCIPALCRFLNHRDESLLIAILRALQTLLALEKSETAATVNGILEAVVHTGGHLMIEELQTCENEEVYELARGILEGCFSSE